MKTKLRWKGYWKPTPELWRKIGDALLVVSTAVNGATFATGYQVIGIIAQMCGILGKIITNFAYHDYNA